jgi:hypothetical protein
MMVRVVAGAVLITSARGQILARLDTAFGDSLVRFGGWHG